MAEAFLSADSIRFNLMILILLFVALSIVAALFAGLLGLLGGVEFDLSSIVGAAILVGGAIVMVMAAILSRPA